MDHLMFEGEPQAEPAGPTPVPTTHSGFLELSPAQRREVMPPQLDPGLKAELRRGETWYDHDGFALPEPETIPSVAEGRRQLEHLAKRVDAILRGKHTRFPLTLVRPALYPIRDAKEGKETVEHARRPEPPALGGDRARVPVAPL